MTLHSSSYVWAEARTHHLLPVPLCTCSRVTFQAIR